MVTFFNRILSQDLVEVWFQYFMHDSNVKPFLGAFSTTPKTTQSNAPRAFVGKHSWAPLVNHYAIPLHSLHTNDPPSHGSIWSQCVQVQMYSHG